jgi:mono/diheme cytochrome c family protein
MKRIARLAILAAAPWLMAAIWMDEQPAYKAYKPPILTPPAGSVPVTGKETVSRDAQLRNPVPAKEESVVRGKTLFDINCAMCHGQTSAERGPVGKKLTPPPPGLDNDMVKSLSDSEIFKAITFGFGRMPSFLGKITPQERWNLVNFLRTRK